MEDASWEPLDNFQLLFPDFKLEDKLVDLEGCVDVFVGKRIGNAGIRKVKAKQ